MTLWLWDVAHGLAAHLRTPTGLNLAIDLGIGDTSTGEASFSPLQALREQGVDRLDEVIITHPHRDHLDDIHNFDLLSPRVLLRPKHLTEDEVRAGNRRGDEAILDKYFEINQRYSRPVPESERPTLAVNAGMDIKTYQPRYCERTNLNNHSIIVFLSHANSTICLPGDNEAPSWRELLADEAFQEDLKRTNILIAAHHGREAGYCSDIFEWCDPWLVCVSDGPDCDTSAVAKYHAHARGWPVFSRSDSSSARRRVLTTRSDGSIRIMTGHGPERPFLNVSVE